jgi:hypothetical protein
MFLCVMMTRHAERSGTKWSEVEARGGFLKSSQASLLLPIPLFRSISNQNEQCVALLAASTSFVAMLLIALSMTWGMTVHDGTFFKRFPLLNDAKVPDVLHITETAPPRELHVPGTEFRHSD